MKKISQYQTQQQQQQAPSNVGTTRVTMEPVYANILNIAQDIVERIDRNRLLPVDKIYGHVDQSGLFGQYKTENPNDIYIDIANIQNKVKSALQGADERTIKKEILKQIVLTIWHETKHQQEFSTTGYSSESGPDTEEQREEPRIEQTVDQLIDQYMSRISSYKSIIIKRANKK